MSTPPPPSGTPPWTPPPIAPKAGTILGLSKAVLAIIVVVVLAVAAVAGLFLAGVIPGLSNSSSSPGPSGPNENVTFTETGLTSGTSWSVTFSGTTHSSTTHSILFTIPNGTYSFSVGTVAGMQATPASGSLTVKGTTTEAIVFSKLPPGQYSVTFSESGLPGSTSWSVTFNGTQKTGTGTSLTFTIGNGSWPFSVGAVTGYTASPSSGNVAVSGGAASQPITFTSTGGGGGGGGPDTYSQAKPIADGVVASHSSSAVLWAAFGVDSRGTYSNSTANTTNASCPLTGGSLGSTYTFPTYSGNYHAGIAALWIFGYYQASPVAEFFVAVSNGAGEYAGEVTGASCVGSDVANETIGVTPVDSSAAASAAAGTPNGTTFIADYSSADADYILVHTTGSAVWAVLFSSCQAGYTGSGSEFDAEVNASTGAVIISSPIIPVTCSGNPVSGGVPHHGAATAPPSFEDVLALANVGRD
jgi:hypothetical protein